MIDQFIFETNISIEVCEGVVDFYHNNDSFKPLQGEFGDKGVPNLEIKDSKDIALPILYQDFDNRIKNYFNSLNDCLDHYFEKFPEAQMPCKISRTCNIQKYNPGGGYKIWHHERTVSKYAVRRHLVWMTYLTDNPNGGTEFKYQNLHVPATVGKTLIWPAEWNYTHRSKIDTEKEKMIITGWVELL